MKYDLLHIQGQPYVLVPLHDYRSMVSGSGSDELPDDVLDALTAREEHPIKILRKYRGMTQAELAESADISRPYLTEIETATADFIAVLQAQEAETMAVAEATASE